MVCLALSESAFVSYFTKPSEENYHQMAELFEHLLKKHNKISTGKSDAEQEEDKEETFHGKDRESKVLRLHKMSRVLLPAVFLLFNLVYWIYYL